jgi:hypothetical protein
MPQSSNRQGFLCADWLTPMSCCLLGYSLATSAYGTALGVIRALHSSGKLETAFCTETRPYNQVHPVALISAFSQSHPSSIDSFYEPFAELCQKSYAQCILFDRISSGLCIWWFKRHKVPSVGNKQKPCTASGFWFAVMHLCGSLVHHNINGLWFEGGCRVQGWQPLSWSMTKSQLFWWQTLLQLLWCP